MIKLNKFFKVFIISNLVLLQISGCLSITGGQPEDIKYVPFIAQIFLEGEFKCGGTFVSDSFVVTAASCVNGALPDQLTVKGGATKLIDVGIIFNVSKIMIHEQYASDTFDVDVAVLKLAAPIESALVQPIGLCNKLSVAGDEAKFYGWGFTTDASSYSNQLQARSVKVMGKRTCKKKYSTTMQITHNMLCAMAEENASCSGDSGSPIIINNQFCGIASGSIGCTHPNVPETFTNVFKVSKFITKVMEEM